MSTKAYAEMLGTPMRQRSADFIYSRETDWKRARKDSHVTLHEAANIIGVGRQTAEKLLPPHDAKCPYGNKTRMWLRSVVETKARELKAEFHDGYMTMEQAKELLGLPIDKASMVLGEHDKYSPYGGGMKLYSRARVEALK